MRVTALLFNPPGKGEYLRKFFDMPEDSMPTSPEEFALRSVRAIKHFWPNAMTGNAITLDKCHQRYVVEGGSWQVEWALDAYIKQGEAFSARHVAGEATDEEFILFAEQIQPTERVYL